MNREEKGQEEEEEGEGEGGGGAGRAGHLLGVITPGQGKVMGR